MPVLNYVYEIRPIPCFNIIIFTLSKRTNKRSASGVSLNLLNPKPSKTAKAWLNWSLDK
jgi:hypothetical protein